MILLLILLLFLIYLVYATLFASHKLSKEALRYYQDDFIEGFGKQIVEQVKRPTVHTIQQPISPNYFRDLDKSLIPVQEKLVNIIVGQFNIQNTIVIEGLRIKADRMLYDMSQHMSIKDIIKKYDPNVNNELLLEMARFLVDNTHLEISKKLMVAKYIVNRTFENDDLEIMYNFVIQVAMNPELPLKLRQEAVDILLLSNNTRYIRIANSALEGLRQHADAEAPINPFTLGARNDPLALPRLLENGNRVVPRNQQGNNILPNRNPLDGVDMHLQEAIWNQFHRTLPKTDRSVYQDGQNVHDSEINTSVLEAARELVEKHRPSQIINFDNELIKEMPHDKRALIEASIHRISTDISTFKYGTTLYIIFQSLLNFIRQNPNSQELNKRLVEELVEMSGMCATGNLARLVNVIQGFDSGINAKIGIKVDAEIYANLKHTVEKSIQEDEKGDEILDDMTSDEKKKFIPFARNIFNQNVPRLLIEYKDIASKEDIEKGIISAFDKYTKTNGQYQIPMMS